MSALPFLLGFAVVLAWDAFRRWLADRREARSVQRQEGASTERLDQVERDMGRTCEALDGMLQAHAERITSLERGLANPKPVRR